MFYFIKNITLEIEKSNLTKIITAIKKQNKAPIINNGSCNKRIFEKEYLT